MTGRAAWPWSASQESWWDDVIEVLMDALVVDSTPDADGDAGHIQSGNKTT